MVPAACDEFAFMAQPRYLRLKEASLNTWHVSNALPFNPVAHLSFRGPPFVFGSASLSAVVVD